MKHTRFLSFVGLVALLVPLATVGTVARSTQAESGAQPAQAAAPMFDDINPDESGFPAQPQVGIGNCPSPCPSGGSGGRVNGLAGVPGDALTYFAASEIGGLFKTTNRGDSWHHLDGHLPTRTWDVAAAPGGLKVYSTSFYDGRIDSLSGIEVSRDGGPTWAHPDISAPSTCSDVRKIQPSAFGIALRPGTDEVLVGTNCGIARSTTSGDAWTQFDPTPSDGVTNSVWDVVALPGGQTYACGDDGLLSSPDGQTWTNLGKPRSDLGGFCSLAISPDEPNVVFVAFASPFFGELFAAFSGDFFEGLVQFSAGGNATSVSWSPIPHPDASFIKDGQGNPVRKSRVPFVVTNKRSAGFDLWLGDGNLFRVPCATPATPGPRCTTDTTKWSGTFSDGMGDFQKAHGDSGDLVFDPTKSIDTCPTLYSSDGGIYRNDKMADSDCHDQAHFLPINVGVHAQLIWGMAGVDRPGIADEDMYIALQDNGFFYTGNAGGSTVMWNQGVGGDVFDVVADTTRVVASSFNLMVGDPGFKNMTEVVNNPTWSKLNTGLADVIAQSGSNQYMIASRGTTADPTNGVLGVPTGVLSTTNIVANPLGTPLGTWPATANPPCHIRVSMAPTGPQPYVLAGVCDWRSPDQLWTYTFKNGSATDKEWRQLTIPNITAAAGFSMFGVDPVNPQRLYAAVVGDGDPRMVRSTNGGATWQVDQGLTDLMNGVRNGKSMFAAQAQYGGDGVLPFPQPTLVAFDPDNPNILVAGGRESGVFVSSDAGESWALLTDPFTPGTSHIPHLPRPFFAYFDHEPLGTTTVYIGTVGRGVWRIHLADSDLSVMKSDAVDPVVAGADLAYTIKVTNGGPDPAPNVTMVDALPSGLTFQSITPPAGWACDSLAAGGTVRCTTPSMAVESATFRVVAHVPADTRPGTVLSNTARVFSAAIDRNPADNAAIETTGVIAQADLAIVSFEAVNPPAQILVGEDLDITLRKIITNHGPSAPMDVLLTRTASAPPDARVTPAFAQSTEAALGLEEQRTVDEVFTVHCDGYSRHTFRFENQVQPKNFADMDPNPANNHAAIALTVECVIPVKIDIKPGQINLNAGGVIPVAVLANKAGEFGLPLAFDPSTIDPASVRFGSRDVVWSGTGGAMEVHGEDHGGGSSGQRMFQFRVDETGLKPGETQACLKGTWFDAAGVSHTFFGCDQVLVG